MLHSNPKLIHLSKILQHKFYSVRHSLSISATMELNAKGKAVKLIKLIKLPNSKFFNNKKDIKPDYLLTFHTQNQYQATYLC